MRTTSDTIIAAFKDPNEGRHAISRTIEATAAFVMGLIDHDADNVKLINRVPETFMTEVSTAILRVRYRKDVDAEFIRITAAMKAASR